MKDFNRPLSEDQMVEIMNKIMSGEFPDEILKEFLIALTSRGENVDEIVGAARVLREKSYKIKAPEDAVDCCGTWGDQSGTYNISTAVALVAAECSAPVAKHGNRSASSRCGTAIRRGRFLYRA